MWKFGLYAPRLLRWQTAQSGLRCAASWQATKYQLLTVHVQGKGLGDKASAAVRVSGLELGGLAGSLSAGFLSDYLLKKNAQNGSPEGTVGLRVRVRVCSWCSC
jgi:hypothetical protein